jgi:leucyl-tRNA synthetase
MEFTNYLNQISESNNTTHEQWDFAIKSLLLLLAPIAPHITEELWELTGNQYSIHNQSIPSFDPILIEDKTTTLVIQVNGKVRDTIEISVETKKEKAEKIALSSEKIQPYLLDQTIIKIIYIPDKLINIVIK